MDIKGEIAAQSQGKLLTAEEFPQLTEIPAELEWLANIKNTLRQKIDVI